MLGRDLKKFIETDLDCGSQTDSLFYTNINLVKDYIENLREWKKLIKLIKINKSQIYKDNNINLYYFDAPSDLSYVIRIFNNNLNINFKQDSFNNRIYVYIGDPFDLFLEYKIFSPKIEENTAWIFPENFHPILGYLYAVIYKNGIDFDDINFKNAVELNKDFFNFIKTMINWDNSLKLNEIENIYYNQKDEFGLPL